jgi:ketosteroid isomerase-like protein
MRLRSLLLLAGSFILVQGCTAPAESGDPNSAESAVEMGPAGEAATSHAAESELVAGVAEDFLAALSAADTAILAAHLTPDAMIYSVRDGEAGPALRSVFREDFLASLGGEDQELLERMWEPVVQVHGRVAMVWTPYDFYLNGAFSHCGTDVFTLLKDLEGWKIASITYNVVREECPPSPLGPPGRRDE